MARKNDNTTTYLILGGIAYLLLAGRGGFGLGRPLRIELRFVNGGIGIPRENRVMRNSMAIEMKITNLTSQNIFITGGRFAVEVPENVPNAQFFKEDVYFYWFGDQYASNEDSFVIGPNETKTFTVLGGPNHKGNILTELGFRLLVPLLVDHPQGRTINQPGGVPINVAGELFIGGQGFRTYRFFAKIDTFVYQLNRGFPDSWDNAIGGPEKRTFFDAILSLLDFFSDVGFPGQEGGQTPGQWEQSGDIYSIPDILNQPGEPFPRP